MLLQNGNALLLVASLLRLLVNTEQTESLSLLTNNKSLLKRFLSVPVEQVSAREARSPIFKDSLSVLKDPAHSEKKSFDAWGGRKRFEPSTNNVFKNNKHLTSSKHNKHSESQKQPIDEDPRYKETDLHTQPQRRKLLFSFETANQLVPNEDVNDELISDMKNFYCSMGKQNYDFCSNKRSGIIRRENQNFVPWGGKRGEFTGKKPVEYLYNDVNDGKWEESKRNYNAWGGKRADTFNSQTRLSNFLNGKQNYKEEGSTEFKNQIKNFVLLAASGDHDSQVNERLNQIIPETNDLFSKDNYYPQKYNVAKKHIPNKINFKERKSKLVSRHPNLRSMTLNYDSDRENQVNKLNNQLSRALLDDQSDTESMKHIDISKDSDNFSHKNFDSVTAEDWVKSLQNVDFQIDRTRQGKSETKFLRSIRIPSLPEDDEDFNYTDKYVPVSSPYRNLRNFEPWAGKRNDNSQSDKTYRATKRGTTSSNYLKSKSDELAKKKKSKILARNFRSFGTWGGKRNYNPWGGKRFDQFKKNVMISGVWGGKENSEYSNGFRDVFSWSFKKRYNPTKGLQLSFHHIPGPKLIFAKGDINTWVNKTRKFNSWGGKRTSLLK